MRTLFIIIVVGALGYLAWVFRDELTGQIQSVTAPEAPAKVEVVETTPPPPAPAPEPVPAATIPARPTVTAPPGSFYVKERTSVEMATGVKALNAGEIVKLMYRNKDGTARVTTGKDELIIKESLLTTDPAQVGQ